MLNLSHTVTTDVNVVINQNHSCVADNMRPFKPFSILEFAQSVGVAIYDIKPATIEAVRIAQRRLSDGEWLIVEIS